MAAHLVKIHESLREQGDTLKRFRAEIESLKSEKLKLELQNSKLVQLK